MLVKICGLREASNIESITQIRPDFLGFIFYKKSPRYALGLLSEKQIRALPASIVPTGVFVNENEENIIALVKRFGFRAVQLHGEESPKFCENLRKKLGDDFLLIKAFGIGRGFDFDNLTPYKAWVQYFLFDAQTEMKGGAGKSFDWSLLEGYLGNTPFFLSGGIGVEEIQELIKELDSKPYFRSLIGLDLNSKLEDIPGRKNEHKVQRAMGMVRNIKFN